MLVLSLRLLEMMACHLNKRDIERGVEERDNGLCHYLILMVEGAEFCCTKVLID